MSTQTTERVGPFQVFAMIAIAIVGTVFFLSSFRFTDLTSKAPCFIGGAAVVIALFFLWRNRKNF